MRDLIAPFRITNGRKFRLADHDPGDTGPQGSRDEASGLLARGLDALREQQERLAAQATWAVLLIFQAMDAAGKDSTIKHVMSGVDPQGCQVSSFKAPSVEELGHDFLWRTTVRLPSRGHIGVFNRSRREEVLVVRVHPRSSARSWPPAVVSKRIWSERFGDIAASSGISRATASWS
jgi:polyphosphate kinase 2 (PPK2 family)